MTDCHKQIEGAVTACFVLNHEYFDTYYIKMRLDPIVQPLVKIMLKGQPTHCPRNFQLKSGALLGPLVISLPSKPHPPR